MKRKAADGGGAESSFLASYDPNAYERPSVAVDVALITISSGKLRTLLVRRKEHPFKDRWALPGGFVGLSETLGQAAARVLASKANLRGLYLEQLYTFSEPSRDPRMRVISAAYYALLEARRFEHLLEAGPYRHDAIVADLDVPLQEELEIEVVARDPQGTPLSLAFDHADMLEMTVKRMQGKLTYEPIAFSLLPQTFTLLELQRVHEAILGRPLNKDSFRRRMLASGDLEATGTLQMEVEHRPAELYRFAGTLKAPRG